MPESLRTRLERWGFNLFPAYRGTGGRITYIADDHREVRIELPLSWRTRNYVGTIFGGSMYAVVDPVYMIILIKTLGPGYIVWDKRPPSGSASLDARSSTRTSICPLKSSTPFERHSRLEARSTASTGWS